MNIQISKELHSTMSRPFYSDAKTAKNVSFFFLVTLFISTRFLTNYWTIADRDIINTPVEPLRPADLPFGSFVDIAPHFGGEIPLNTNFWGVNTE